MADRALTEADLHFLNSVPAVLEDCLFPESAGAVRRLLDEHAALREAARAAKQVDDAGQRVQEALSDNFSPQQHNAACEYEALCRVKLAAALAALEAKFPGVLGREG